MIPTNSGRVAQRPKQNTATTAAAGQKKDGVLGGLFGSEMSDMWSDMKSIVKDAKEAITGDTPKKSRPSTGPTATNAAPSSNSNSSTSNISSSISTASSTTSTTTTTTSYNQPSLSFAAAMASAAAPAASSSYHAASMPAPVSSYLSAPMSTMPYVPPTITEISPLTFDWVSQLNIDPVQEETILTELQKYNASLNIAISERETLMSRLRSMATERDSRAGDKDTIDSLSQQLRALQGSVQFQRVHEMQTEINKMREEKTLSETRLVTVNEENEVMRAQLVEWKKKTEDSINSKKSLEAELKKSQLELQSLRDELSNTKQLKVTLESEIASFNARVEAKVSEVRTEYEAKLTTAQYAFEDMMAQRNNVMKKVRSQARELDRRLRDTREKKTLETEAHKLEVERLREEVDRKNRSLQAALEALDATGISAGRDTLDTKTQLKMQELQDTISDLRAKVTALRNEKLTYVQQIEEFKATGRIKSLTESSNPHSELP